MCSPSNCFVVGFFHSMKLEVFRLHWRTAEGFKSVLSILHLQWSLAHTGPQSGPRDCLGVCKLLSLSYASDCLTLREQCALS